MKLLLALLAASTGLVFGHDGHAGQHVPKILGARRFLSELEARRKAMSDQHAKVEREQLRVRKRDTLKQRQDDDAECGPGIGSCAPGDCCSAEGWCGRGIDYCIAPDCQIDYGPGCDANQKPSGPDTSEVARPKVGGVPYGGAGIYDCENPGDIALTFDDGPYIYTNDLLDKLKSYGAKATFFLTGTNLGKGQINDPSTIYPDIIRRMHAEGHQIASHTWSHQNASQLSDTQFTNQIIWNEIAINSVLGFFPTYMRPPYSICESNCQNILSNLGYHIVYFDLDTEGYLHATADQIQTSKNIWDDAIDGSNPETDNYLQIEHDIHYQVVYNLTDYILTSLFSAGYRAVTVGECLGDPPANWYRTGPSGPVTLSNTVTPTRSTISVAPTHTGASTDGTCGNGVTCVGTPWGDCCSVYGYCGAGEDYCSAEKGCQAAWGECDGVAPSSPTRRSIISTRSTVATRTTIATKTTITTRSTIPTTSTIVTSTSTSSSTSSAAQPTQTGLATSVDGRCGSEVQQTCKGSQFGDCCSRQNECTSSILACLPFLGCQEEYGDCI
ncbi:hypothetical protein VTK26DRAFT_7855 [Humicola hyalothermophila]